MKKALVIVVVMFSLSGWSQNDRENYDTLYLKEFANDIFYPFTFSNVKNHNIYISNFYEEDAWVNYFPNSPLFFGLGFDYKWMTFSYAVPMQSKKKKKGSNFNLFYGISRRKFRISLMYQQYQGFFQQDPTLPRDWFDQNEDFPFRPDISDYIFQGTFFYLFNHTRVSYRSSFLYFEKQLKSAGSFTLGTDFFVSGITADSSLVPSSLDSSFGEEVKRQKALDVNVGLKFGYMYTYVFHKNWHLSGHFSPTIYLNKDRLIQEINDLDSVSIFSRSIFLGLSYRLVLGYDNDSYFAGIMFNGTNTQQDFAKSAFSTDYSVLEVYFGKRIQTHGEQKKKRKFFD